MDNSDFGVRERYRKILFKQLEIEYIYDKYPFRTEIIDSIVDLMAATLDGVRENADHNFAGKEEELNHMIMDYLA